MWQFTLSQSGKDQLERLDVEAGGFVYTMRIFYLFIFLLLVGITEYAIASPPQVRDETSDWKTYRNGQYWFEVRYPESWSFKDITTDPTDERRIADAVFMIDSIPIMRAREAMHLPSRGLKIIIKGSYSEDMTHCPSGDHLIDTDRSIIDGTYYTRCKTEFGLNFFSIPIVRNSFLYTLSYPAESIDTKTIDEILSTFKFIPLENQSQTSNIESKESVEYTTPGGISPPIFKALQWLVVLLIIAAFIFKFRLPVFKIVFAAILTVTSIILLNSCFIVDASLPKFCEYRMLSSPVFIFVDLLGDTIRTVAMRNLIIPIATPLIAFEVWYIIGSLIFAVYRKLSRRSVV